MDKNGAIPFIGCQSSFQETDAFKGIFMCASEIETHLIKKRGGNLEADHQLTACKC